MDMKSLAGMAAATQKPDRGDPSRKDFKASKPSGRGANFDGLLKSFMTGDDSVSKAGKLAGQSGSGSRSAGVSSQAGAPQNDASQIKDTGGSKSGAKSSTASEKTKNEKSSRHDREARDAAEQELDEEVAAAAQEAADLIWSLLYPDLSSANYLVDGPPTSLSLSILADTLGVAGAVSTPLSGMEAGGLEQNAMQAALETANVSAEMNIAAIKSAIEDLLNGVPRSVIEDALAAKASEMGIAEPEGGFLRLAEELGLTSMALEGRAADENANALLAQLEKSANEAGRQNALSGAAETSGIDEGETNIYGLLGQFLKENPQYISSATASPAGAEQLLQSFATWLNTNGLAADMKAVAGDGQSFARMVHQAFSAARSTAGAAESGEGADIFSALGKNLESALQSDGNKKFSSAFLATMSKLLGDDGEGAPLAQTGEGGKDAKAMIADSAAVNGGQANARPGQTGQGGASSMLEQIENIEKLGEVLKMRNSNGVKNLTLQLSPPELGKVSIRVEARDGVVSALLRVEKPDAAAQIANNLQHLRETLKAQGIELGQLEVRQESGNQAANDGNGGHRRQPESSGDGDGTGGRRFAHGMDEESESVLPQYSGVNGGPLNLYA